MVGEEAGSKEGKDSRMERLSDVEVAQGMDLGQTPRDADH